MLTVNEEKILKSEYKFSFGTFLEEKFKKFKKEKCNNYSDSYFVDFILKYKNADASEVIRKNIFLPMLMVAIIPILLLVIFKDPSFLLLLSLFSFSVLVVQEMKFFQLKGAKILLKNEEYKKGLAFKMFEKTTVDKEVLEVFAKKYGKEATIKLLNNNKNPTYENIYDAMSIINESEIITKKDKNVEEIAECLIR